MPNTALTFTHNPKPKPKVGTLNCPHESLNETYCKGYAGELLYDVLVSQVGKLQDICAITGLRVKQVLGMRDGDITLFTFDDLQRVAQACYWRLVCSWTEHGYQVRLKTATKTYRLDDKWDSDAEQIRAEVARRREPTDLLA